MKKNFLPLLCILACVLVGCAEQPPVEPSTEVSADASYPITSVFFPDDCTTFTGVALDTVQALLVSEDNPSYTSVDGVIFSKDLKILVAFPAGRTGAYTIPDGTLRIDAQAFENCAIESVYVPNSVQVIGNKAFAGCMSLRELSLPASFAADGEILPHSAELPEYCIEGLCIRHRDTYPDVQIESVLPELKQTVSHNYHNDRKNTIYADATYMYTLHKYEWERNSADMEMVYTMTTAAYLLEGGHVRIPEGYTKWEDGDLQHVQFPIRSLTFPNSVDSYGFSDFLRDLARSDTASIQWLADLYVYSDNPNYVSVDGVIFTKDLKELVAFPIGRTGSYSVPEGTERIGYAAFRYSMLESVYIPDTVTFINMDGLYSESIRQVDLPRDVTAVGYFLPSLTSEMTIRYRGSAADFEKTGLRTWMPGDIDQAVTFAE